MGVKMEKIDQFQEIINNSKKIVFFGGAGVSTESGIPDFRSVDGLYSMKYDYLPEEILSNTFFRKNINEFYKFYKDKMIVKGIKPNYSHLFLKKLEEAGKLLSVITQNIDGLHFDAGNIRVWELHGSIKRNYCMKCKKFYDEDYVLNSKDVPVCSCGGVIKPDVVLYEENLNDNILYNAIKDISNADCLIVGGTSLTVYPAAGLIHYFNGDNIILINKSKTDYDKYAKIVFNDNISDILRKIKI